MITAQNLKKKFGSFVAVDGVSLKIEKGDIVGFLGPNGAGKTTTMRILSGFLYSDFGDVNICGYDIVKQRQLAQSCIGYLPEATSGFANLTPREFLIFCCGSRGIKSSNRRKAIERVTSQVDLPLVIDKKIRSLSKGWRQRVWLAQALIHDPSILILDEPTDGLDPNQKDLIRSLIKSFSANKAVILSTHILEEAEHLCNRIILINEGKVIIDDIPENLFNQAGRLSDFFRQNTV